MYACVYNERERKREEFGQGLAGTFFSPNGTDQHHSVGFSCHRTGLDGFIQIPGSFHMAAPSGVASRLRAPGESDPSARQCELPDSWGLGLKMGTASHFQYRIGQSTPRGCPASGEAAWTCLLMDRESAGFFNLPQAP